VTRRCKAIITATLPGLALAALGACAAAPAPKVACDSNLRPINPGIPEQTGAAVPQRQIR